MTLQDLNFQALTDANMNAAVSVYAETWGRDAYAVRLHFQRHRLYPSWRGLLADTGGEAVGFVYGNRSLAGQWWHDRVSAQLKDAGPLENCWVLSELAVRPAFRNLGLGGVLHDRILDSLDFPRVALSTQLSNPGAQRFYARHGWRVIVPAMRFSLFDEPFVIMAKELGSP